jgi:hypothetical protein
MRIDRLQALARRLSAEDLSRSHDDIRPLEHMERKAYRTAIHQALHSRGEARIVMSEVVRRLEESKPQQRR